MSFDIHPRITFNEPGDPVIVELSLRIDIHWHTKRVGEYPTVNEANRAAIAATFEERAAVPDLDTAIDRAWEQYKYVGSFGGPKGSA
jgi:hypothetical protein